MGGFVPGPITAVRRVHEPLKSTVLLPGDCVSGELIAFSASIGMPMNGAGNTNVICTNGDTNVLVGNQLVDEGMIVREVWFEIPKVAPARLQLPLPCGKRRDYCVGEEDVRQILDSTTLAFFVGGDRPFLRQRLSAAIKGPESAAEVVWRGVFKLKSPVEIRRIEKFWVTLAWPERKPTFDKICADSEVRPRIPIVIYLVP
jgi:hypothetical protein